MGKGQLAALHWPWLEAPLAASRCGSRTVGPSGGARSVWSPALGLWQPRGSLRPQHCHLPTLQPFHCPWSPGWAPGHPPGQVSLTSWAQPQRCRHPLGLIPLVQPSWKASLWRRHPFGFWPRSMHRLWTGPGHQLEPGAHLALPLWPVQRAWEDRSRPRSRSSPTSWPDHQ